MSVHPHEQSIVDKAIDSAWDVAIEAGIFRHYPANRVDPECWDGDVAAEVIGVDDEGLRVKCTNEATGEVIEDATWEVEGGFGDDGSQGRPVQQRQHDVIA